MAARSCHHQQRSQQQRRQRRSAASSVRDSNSAAAALAGLCSRRLLRAQSFSRSCLRSLRAASAAAGPAMPHRHPRMVAASSQHDTWFSTYALVSSHVHLVSCCCCQCSCHTRSVPSFRCFTIALLKPKRTRITGPGFSPFGGTHAAAFHTTSSFSV